MEDNQKVIWIKYRRESDKKKSVLGVQLREVAECRLMLLTIDYLAKVRCPHRALLEGGSLARPSLAKPILLSLPALWLPAGTATTIEFIGKHFYYFKSSQKEIRSLAAACLFTK